MKTIRIDGKEFSENTIKEALKKHCDFKSDVEPKQVKVHCFRATKVAKSSDFGYPYNLGNMRYNTNKWNGKCADHSTAQITCFKESEVEQIIAGLQGLLVS